MCLGGSLDKRQMCFGPVCRIDLAVTGPSYSITMAVTVSPASSIITAIKGLAPVITAAAFTTYINYVSLRRISVKDRFMVWLHFILPLIEGYWSLPQKWNR